MRTKRFHFMRARQICLLKRPVVVEAGRQKRLPVQMVGRKGRIKRGVKISACLLAGALAVSQAAAAPAPGTPPPTGVPAPPPPPLPPAGGAPRPQAQRIGRPLLYWGAGGAAIITGVILIGQDNNGTSTTATTGTN